MPSKSKRLQTEAREATKYRKHDLSLFKRHGHSKHDPPGIFTYRATCKNCGMGVLVNTKPLPNEIDICGEAVALNCTKPK